MHFKHLRALQHALCKRVSMTWFAQPACNAQQQLRSLRLCHTRARRHSDKFASKFMYLHTGTAHFHAQACQKKSINLVAAHQWHLKCPSARAGMHDGDLRFRRPRRLFDATQCPTTGHVDACT